MNASEIPAEQDAKSKQDDPEMIGNLHHIKEISLETRRYLEKGQLHLLGELLHVHWETKKKRSAKMTDPFLDEYYEVARKNGAVGGFDGGPMKEIADVCVVVLANSTPQVESFHPALEPYLLAK